MGMDLLEETKIMQPTEVLASILQNPKDPEHVRSLVTEDVMYVSLNYDNPDLRKIMPWAGSGRGAERIAKTFVDVGRRWENLEFQVEALFGDDQYAGMFGRFTDRSRVVGKLVTSPFSVFAKVIDGRCRKKASLKE